MGRALGVDYGKKRIGLALSDPLWMFASPLTTLENVSNQKIFAEFKTLITTHAIDTVVFGLPKRTDGQASEMAEVVEGFIIAFQQAFPDCIICRIDERFTSRIATQALQAMGKKPSRDKGLVDQTAAALILQSYLDQASH